MEIFRRGPPNVGVECRWVRQQTQIAILDEYLAIGSMTAALRTTTATVNRDNRVNY